MHILTKNNCQKNFAFSRIWDKRPISALFTDLFCEPSLWAWKPYMMVDFLPHPGEEKYFYSYFYFQVGVSDRFHTVRKSVRRYAQVTIKFYAIVGSNRVGYTQGLF